MRRILRVGGGRMMSGVASRMSPPLLMLPPSLDDSGNVSFNFHGVSDERGFTRKNRIRRSGEESNGLPLSDGINDVNFVGSSHGWLALHNWVNHDMFLLNPMSGQHIKLPPPRTLPFVEDPLTGGVSRVRLSCSPDEGCCRAMMIAGEESRLAVCVPGRSTEWTPLGELFGERDSWYDVTQGWESCRRAAREYEDVVYSSRHKLFFCITRFTTELEGWNVVDPLSPTIDWKVQHKDELKFDRHEYPWPSRSEKESELKALCWHFKYLVFAEQSDELFLVVRHVNPRTCHDGSFFKRRIYYSKLRGCDYSFCYKTVAFDVYKIDREDGKLRYMEEGSLEGLAMLVGINDSYAVSASEFPELKPNSIYFGDEYRLMRMSGSYVHKNYGGHDNGIYDYETKTFSSCCGRCPLNRNGNVTMINHPPLWFTPSTNFS